MAGNWTSVVNRAEQENKDKTRHIIPLMALGSTQLMKNMMSSTHISILSSVLLNNQALD